MDNLEKLHQLLPNENLSSYDRPNQFVMAIDTCNRSDKPIQSYEYERVFNSDVRWLVITPKENYFVCTTRFDWSDEFTKGTKPLRYMSNQSICDVTAVVRHISHGILNIKMVGDIVVRKVVQKTSTTTLKINTFEEVETIYNNFKELTNYVAQQNNPILAKFGVMSEINQLMFDDYSEPYVSSSTKDSACVIDNVLHNIFNIWKANNSPSSFYSYITNTLNMHRTFDTINEEYNLYSVKDPESAVANYNTLLRRGASIDLKYHVRYDLLINDKHYNVSFNKLYNEKSLQSFYSIILTHQLPCDSRVNLQNSIANNTLVYDLYKDTYIGDSITGTGADSISNIVDNYFYGAKFTLDFDEAKNTFEQLLNISKKI
jgi:hypothetical protein